MMAYRSIVGALKNGKHIVPLDFGYIFDPETLLLGDIAKTKLDFVKDFYHKAKLIFPNIKIKLAANGLFATITIF